MQDPITPDPTHFNTVHTIGDRSPDPGWAGWRWIIDRNPMFLLSGVFMFAGCYMVSRHIHAIDPADVPKGTIIGLLIGLLVVLNLYEFLVILLGLILARSRTLVRDSRHLLGLALLLLVDASFIYNETGIVSLHAGAAIAAVATLLAWGKAYAMIRALRIRTTIPAMGVMALSLAALYALPVVVRALAHDGFLDAKYALAIWCGLGLIVALYAMPRRWVKPGLTRSADHLQLQQLVSAGLILLPLISLMGHAAAALWVYENAFEPAMLSPVLLGLAAIILRHHESLGGARPTAQAAAIIVASAVVASLLPGEGLIYTAEHNTWLAMSPLRGVLLASPLLLGWGWYLAGRHPLGLVNVAIPVVAAGLGHTPGTMLIHLRWLYNQLAIYLPSTQMQWGITAIAAAFGCLLLGGLLSWWRRAGKPVLIATASDGSHATRNS